ncbi:hypothetical protein PEBR_37745 [Penicillium brasilianum]|uniref:CCHC-type domain-containing protein n=1 Tax=Penicillium brasilianum TaxID=104259 RepID=A0A1S9RB01_PENBI|nr:hypothetical protein PEBR_37745 [Penicillium brasilianum]
MPDNVTDRSRRGSRRSLTLDEQPDAEKVEVTDVDDLISWIKNDPETAWRILCNRMKDIEDLKNQVAHLTVAHQEETNRLREQIATMATRETPSAQDQQMEEEYARMRKERDSLLTVMKMMRTTEDDRTIRETSMTSAYGNKKSTKMPDPPMFSDGKDVKFKDWKTEIKRKLLLNEDNYPTAAHQLAYVNSRCEGKALRHISPRMQEDATATYQTAQDVFDYLQSVFHDPNHQQVARDEYLVLKIDPKQDFGDFLAEFTYLAEEAEQPVDLRKRDLYRKLPALLQNQVMIDAGQSSVTLEEFVQKCQIAARLISQQIANRAENRNRNPNRTGTNASNRSQSDSQPPKSSDRPDDKEKATLLKEGRCFVCHEQGHISRNCPTKKQAAANAAITEPSKKDSKKTEDLKAAEENGSDSGKE